MTFTLCEKLNHVKTVSTKNKKRIHHQILNSTDITNTNKLVTKFEYFIYLI